VQLLSVLTINLNVLRFTTTFSRSLLLLLLLVVLNFKLSEELDFKGWLPVQ